MKAAALRVAGRAAALDYLELVRPRLTLVVLIVVGLGAWLASAGVVQLLVVVRAVLGTALVAAGASALNMLLERHHDARMPRTWNRPLPAGRLQPGEVRAFGAVLTAAGLALLLAGTTPLAALLAALTSASYLGLYTPLKRVTTLNTHLGAVPGALPALIGWAAVRGQLDPAAWTLFAIVYLWQLPHFLSIAWRYREDYARGGFRMLPAIDPEGRITGRQALLGALALLPASLLPTLAGLSGPGYFAGALALGIYFVSRATAFAWARTATAAQRLTRASLLYLPLLFALMFLDQIP
ncbi:MAG: heme o synthase [Planctomycetota bacterium]